MSWFEKKTDKDFVSVLDSIISGTAKKSAEIGGDRAATKLATYLGYEAFSKVSGPLAGALFASLIEALLKNADESKKLIRLLKAEPYKTGIRELKHILHYDRDNDRSEHTIRRLEFVVDKLSEALSFVIDDRNNVDQLYLHLLIGVCEIRISGASNLAIGRFSNALVVMDQLVRDEDMIRYKLGGYISENVTQSDIMIHMPAQRIGGIAWTDPGKMAKKHNDKLRRQENKLNEYKNLRNSILNLIDNMKTFPK